MLIVEKLYKNFGTAEVLKDISLNVEKNNIVALIGKNGAGKSTLLEIIEGLSDCDSGDVKRNYKRLGAQLQKGGLPAEFSVMEVIKLFSNFRDEYRYDEGIFEFFKINELKNKKIKFLSVGEYRKVILTLCFINKPDFLILDEPTAGLDIETKVELYEIIQELKKNNYSILFATHDMNEVVKLADYVYFMENGEIKRGLSKHEVEVIIKNKFEIHLSNNSDKYVKRIQEYTDSFTVSDEKIVVENIDLETKIKISEDFKGKIINEIEYSVEEILLKEIFVNKKGDNNCEK